MKRVAIFVGLKLVEVMGVVVLLGIVGLITEQWCSCLRWSYAWWYGAIVSLIIGIAILVLVGFVLVGIYQAIKANWEKAGELAERKKEDQ